MIQSFGEFKGLLIGWKFCARRFFWLEIRTPSYYQPSQAGFEEDLSLILSVFSPGGEARRDSSGKKGF